MTTATSRVLGTAKQVESALATLKLLGREQTREDMGHRYGITGPTAEAAFGVPVGMIRDVGKQFRQKGDAGKAANHALALALWEVEGPGTYEARMLAAFVDDPALVTPAQMDRWAKDFDNWGICDTVCFHLFDKTPPALAFAKVKKWATSRHEFFKRASFALHAKSQPDEPFLKCLPLIERAASDDRNFVKKGVSWALRGIGRRKSAVLRAAALAMAKRLAESETPSARWIGKDALRDLVRSKPLAQRSA